MSKQSFEFNFALLILFFKLKKWHFDAFLSQMKIFVQQNLLHGFIDVVKLFGEYIFENLSLGWGEGALGEDKFLADGFYGEVEENGLIGCGHDEGVNLLVMGFEVVSAEIGHVLKDSQQFLEQIDGEEE
jgi:hypothetical protein